MTYTDHPNEPRQFWTQSELAEVLGFHRSMIQKIERSAKRKIKAAFEREAFEAGKTVAEWLFEAGTGGA